MHTVGAGAVLLVARLWLTQLIAAAMQ